MTRQNEVLDSAIVDGLVEDFHLTAFKELRRTIKVEIGGGLYEVQLWYDHLNQRCPWDSKVLRVDEETQASVDYPDFPWASDRDEETVLRTVLLFLEERVSLKSI